MGTAENGRQISLYPNPTNANITVKAEDMKRIEVISLLGHVVYEAEVHGDETILNLSQYHDGVYLLCVITGNGTIKKHVTVLK